MTKRILIGFWTVLLSAAAVTNARAELIRITPLGLPSPGYEEAGYEVSPVLIGGDGFRVTFNSGTFSPTKTLLDPVLLIIGVPDTSVLPASTPSLTFSTSNPAYTVGISHGTDTNGDGEVVYGGSWNTSTGYVNNVFDALDHPNSVYELIGLTPDGSDSQNYPNWSGNTGLSSWDLFVFVLEFTPDFQKGGWAEFGTNLPVGSYVVGYGCTRFDSTSDPNAPLCKTSGTTQSTPFTFAGLVVSEPSVSALMLPALGLFFGALRTSRRRRAF